jgi:hypothetical protein
MDAPARRNRPYASRGGDINEAVTQTHQSEANLPLLHLRSTKSLAQSKARR